MKKTDRSEHKLPSSVIAAKYGYKLMPIRKGIFRKDKYEKEKLKRIKAAYNRKMREAGRDIHGWNREYIILTNSLN